MLAWIMDPLIHFQGDLYEFLPRFPIKSLLYHIILINHFLPLLCGKPEISPREGFSKPSTYHNHQQIAIRRLNDLHVGMKIRKFIRQ